MDEKTKLKNNVLSNVRAVLLSVKGTCPIRQVAGKTFFESRANYNWNNHFVQHVFLLIFLIIIIEGYIF